MYSFADFIFTYSLISFNIGYARSVTVGSRVILPCNFSSVIQPEYSVEWYKRSNNNEDSKVFDFVYNSTAEISVRESVYNDFIGRSIKHTFQYNKGVASLNIPQVKLCDGARYECKVTTAAYDDSFYYDLSVEQSDPPPLYFGFASDGGIQETYDNDSVIKAYVSTGQPATLDCIFDRVSPVPTITWRRHEEVLKEGEVMEAIEKSYNSTTCDYYVTRRLVITPTAHHVGSIRYACRYSGPPYGSGYIDGLVTVKFISGSDAPCWHFLYSTLLTTLVLGLVVQN